MMYKECFGPLMTNLYLQSYCKAMAKPQVPQGLSEDHVFDTVFIAIFQIYTDACCNS